MDGPNPIVSVSADAGRPKCLTRIIWRRIGIAFGRATRHGILAPSHPLGHLGPLPQQRDDVVAIVRRDVERAEVHPILLRREDARLPLAAERNGLVQPAKVGAGRGRPARERTRTRGPDDGGGYPRGAEQLASANPPRRIRFRRRGFLIIGGDDTLHLAYLLGQGVDGPRQLLALRLGHLVVGNETVALTILSSSASTSAKRWSTRLPSSASRLDGATPSWQAVDHASRGRGAPREVSSGRRFHFLQQGDRAAAPGSRGPLTPCPRR